MTDHGAAASTESVRLRESRPVADCDLCAADELATIGSAVLALCGPPALGPSPHRDGVEAYTPPMWNKCSVCKKPIEFGAPYLKCAISTCNRKRFQLYFCSDSCWDAHNPDQNHRNPAYTEHIAPKAPGA